MQTNHQAGAKNSRATKSKQARKTPGPTLPAVRVKQTTPNEVVTWEPDRFWHAEQRRIREELAGLQGVIHPMLISEPKEKDERMIYAKDAQGKEHFFLEQPMFQHPGERSWQKLSRRAALALHCVWTAPDCLRMHLVEVLRKGGAW